ncbi:hypothetical protein GDO81_025802 [Engystomops pustulosus]|uniref:Uncharacterized protein n=1 Tax=Engystomops pustulosus TaxID=76066 RepID=A0AAV6YHR4_ENGPU|nr:hypothetical protein GDO81_025802 [Engystomops pustulosus]
MRGRGGGGFGLTWPDLSGSAPLWTHIPCMNPKLSVPKWCGSTRLTLYRSGGRTTRGGCCRYCPRSHHWGNLLQDGDCLYL